MPIPDYQSLMLPVLRIASDRNEHSLSEIREQIADELKLTEDELAERLASDSQTIFANRIAWAVQYLKSAGALRPVRRGVYAITDRGISLFDSHPSAITVRTLRQFPEFAEFEGKGSERENGSVAVTPAEAKATPEESLESSFQVLRDALAHELLEAVRNGTPAAFERIVVDLLVAMGYGGSVEDAGKVVGKSGDRGDRRHYQAGQTRPGRHLRSGKTMAERRRKPGDHEVFRRFDEAPRQSGRVHHNLDFHERCARIRGSVAAEDRADRRSPACFAHDRTRCRRVGNEVVHVEAARPGLLRERVGAARAGCTIRAQL